MFSRVVVTLFVAAVLAVDGARYSRTVTYDGEIVVRCNKEGRGVASFLQKDFVDVWQFRPDGTVDVRVSKEHFDALVPSPECTLLISDVEAYVRRVENVTTAPAEGWFEEYQMYDDILAWYRELEGNNPKIVKFEEDIGESYVGRGMHAVTISSEETPEDANIIYSQCQIHAREWISGATCMYIVNQLVEGINNGDDSIPKMKFVFIPFVNPDGYEYTWSNDRLWRKNRHTGTTCDGVDLNRNYNDHWGGDGSSGNECSETYRGRSAASEPETQTTSNYFKSIRNNIVGAIDWHSFSQLILRPYGWTREDCPDEEQLRDLGEKMSETIFGVHGERYTSQRSVQLYPTTGTASDWFYSDDANVNNQYRAAGITIELRDTGRYGFELPPDQIIPTGEEMYPAFLEFARSLNEKPLQK